MCHHENPYLALFCRRRAEARVLFLLLGFRALFGFVFLRCLGLSHCGFFVRRLAFVRGVLFAAFAVRRRGFLFALRQVRSFEALSVKIDFCDADRRERLAVAVNFFVLLLAFEVEDQNLVRAAGFHDLSADHSVFDRAKRACFARHGDYVAERNGLAMAFRQLLNSYNISRSDTILLTPGANHRVHNFLPCPFQPIGWKGLAWTLGLLKRYGLLTVLLTQAGTESTGKPCNFNAIAA